MKLCIRLSRPEKIESSWPRRLELADFVQVVVGEIEDNKAKYNSHESGDFMIAGKVCRINSIECVPNASPNKDESEYNSKA